MTKLAFIKKYTLLILTVAVIFCGVFFITQYSDAQTLKLENPLKNITGESASPQVFIGRIIQAILGLVGSIALVMFVYGGLTWMLSQGNDQKIQKGKDIIVWAVLGLVVIFTSYAIVSFILTTLTKG